MSESVDAEIKRLRSRLKELEQQRKSDPISSTEKEGLRRFLKSIGESDKLDRILEEARHYRRHPEVLSVEVEGDSTPLRFEKILRTWKHFRSTYSSNTIVLTSAGKFLITKARFGEGRLAWTTQIECSDYDIAMEGADWLLDTYEFTYSDRFIQSLVGNQPIPQRYTSLVRSRSFINGTYPDVVKRCEIGRLQWGLRSLLESEQIVSLLVRDINPIDIPLSSLSEEIPYDSGFKHYDDDPKVDYRESNGGLVIMLRAILNYCQDIDFLRDPSPLERNLKDVLTEYIVLEKIS